MENLPKARKKSSSVLESVLKRDPNHLGANHYYIHAVEASPHPERALPSAERLAKLAPAAGHLVHMPAHIYSRVGDHPAAAHCNELAVAATGSFWPEHRNRAFTDSCITATICISLLSPIAWAETLPQCESGRA